MSKYKLGTGSIKNRNINVTNLEIGYYQNKKGRFYDLYIYNTIFVFWVGVATKQKEK